MNTENKERGIPFISIEMTSADIYFRGVVLHRRGTISLSRGRNRFGVKIPDYLPYATHAIHPDISMAISWSAC